MLFKLLTITYLIYQILNYLYLILFNEVKLLLHSNLNYFINFFFIISSYFLFQEIHIDFFSIIIMQPYLFYYCF